MTHEYEFEPIKGLPYKLPEDEEILWQGSPRWLTLAKHLCHLRFVTAYFILLIGYAVYAANADGRTVAETLKAVAWLSAMMGVVVGLMGGFAYLCGRTTIYTITTRRVVLRYGIGFNKAVNVPLRFVKGAGLRLFPDGSGDIPLTLAGSDKIAYLILWPHARPWHFKKTEPMLRGVRDAEKAAEALKTALSSFAATAVPGAENGHAGGKAPLTAAGRASLAA
jgi:hypothetical protein